MSTAELKFYHNGYAAKIENDPAIPEDEKKELIAGYGPDAGEFAPRQEESRLESAIFLDKSP